jgi:lipid-binding SYLF domain-containing protein
MPRSPRLGATISTVSCVEMRILVPAHTHANHRTCRECGSNPGFSAGIAIAIQIGAARSSAAGAWSLSIASDGMRKLAICCGLCLLASSAIAAWTRNEVRQLGDAATVLSELRGAPDRGIPEELWNRAQCVLVVPSMKKAAFVSGGEAASGVMSCRRAKGWSAPVFMHLAKGSLGLQIGVEQVDLVMLVMNRRGADKLLQDKVSLGADASLAAGPVGRSANAATDAQMNADMLAYSRSQGLFAGIDLSGGVLRPDAQADARAYGSDVTARDIVEGTRRVPVLAAARSLVRALARDVTATSGRRRLLDTD